jgi:hypothetical protein
MLLLSVHDLSPNADCPRSLQAKRNFFWRDRVRSRTDKSHSPTYFSRMPTGTPPPPDMDLDTQAQLALEEARAMSPGPEKTETAQRGLAAKRSGHKRLYICEARKTTEELARFCQFSHVSVHHSEAEFNRSSCTCGAMPRRSSHKRPTANCRRSFRSGPIGS